MVEQIIYMLVLPLVAYAIGWYTGYQWQAKKLLEMEDKYTRATHIRKSHRGPVNIDAPQSRVTKGRIRQRRKWS
jgi:hypothetical protein